MTNDPPPSFPALSPECLAALACRNAAWSRRRALWLTCAPPPWWGPGLIVSPELRGIYDKWLPFDEFASGLSSIARLWLPSEEWLPLPLRRKIYLSLPDFWAAMPARFASRLTFSPEELLPLFCAMADPPRFGTDSGRYPEQLRCLEALSLSNAPLTLLDIGCGVGLNTLEIALHLSRHHNLRVLGLTAEWLEVWMARTKTLPHSPKRQETLRAFPNSLPVSFNFGLADNFNAPPADVIVCNGLLGGRFFHSHENYAGFLHSCRRCLAPNGTVFIANRFHEGMRHNLLTFMKVASDAGFTVTTGNWHSFSLRFAPT